MTLLERVSSLSEVQRRMFLDTLSARERQGLALQVDAVMGTPFAGYRYDPIGFIHDVLGETTWSKMDQILDSVLRYKVTCVPAGHSVSKSHTASRVVAWWNSVHPPGTALTITTATTFQQVKTIMWPHIRKMVARHNLPGRTNTTEWVIPTADEENYLTAYGFSASDNDEAAVQGRHAPHFLIVVDEAGGVSHELGKALWSLMTGGHTRMLLIGNPSTEEENTWFQKRCESGRANTNVIPIPVFETPNFTGEDAGMCRACPPGTIPHEAKTHLCDVDWLREVEDEFGADSAYIEARAYARFPTHIADKVLPLSWLEMVEAKQWPDEEPEHAPIALGCDIAADGGDEFVIARRIGHRAKIVHHAAGAENENAVDVAERILQEIRVAEEAHTRWEIDTPVRVKIDTIGVGWGVVGMLTRWSQTPEDERHYHQAVIVPINVAETADDSEKFGNKRAEMWWTMRELIQPIRRRVSVFADTGAKAEYDYLGKVRLEVDTKTLAQLTAPMYRTDGAGRVTIEKKKEIKKRTGGKSPDRGEAILLAFYDPSTNVISTPAFTPITVPRATRSWRQIGE
ncbi:terminase [Microbacterium phage ValentiniPuff]|uniref:Terminase n=1 Tax=Microbacterium phage ValentiniPuff TaxID=2315705 RepID=A0A386KNX7_9CAUD|nr:terminase [Microbacterium phage ValentiniPuff]